MTLWIGHVVFSPHTAMSDESGSELQINVKGIVLFSIASMYGNIIAAGPNELKLQIAISSDKTVLELKQAIAEKSDVEADRQRLIYSGASCASTV
jgi:ubiquilin